MLYVCFPWQQGANAAIAPACQLDDIEICTFSDKHANQCMWRSFNIHRSYVLLMVRSLAGTCIYFAAFAIRKSLIYGNVLNHHDLGAQKTKFQFIQQRKWERLRCSRHDNTDMTYTYIFQFLDPHHVRAYCSWRCYFHRMMKISCREGEGAFVKSYEK